ncbi:hypothetical protein SAMN05216315_10811 [Nitrosospira sp. Nsp18]|uniref:hypothetical protein n=1 Tax=Nitrosospira sp. Nsp18 TaxID=1855334 RepID=UPI00088E7789|nr:hypothetical protein [Nitrosospira sp. Nsp18]SDA16527.1 hypothetical protein SAMN05216315_10811 [Nitrosospira sp. Nsp18]
MTFENELATLNEWYFFREFTYSKTTFSPEPSQEVELADSILWIGDLLVVYQLKEREVQSATTVEAEKRWFERKILRQATRQIRDTLTYLNYPGTIEIQNQRGHAFGIDIRTIHELHKLILYLPHALLPESCREIKHHRSGTAGVIHIIPANDYLGIVKTLLTPAEVADYLGFREALINRWEVEIAAVPEPALVGQYLNGDIDVPPSVDFIEYLYRLDHRPDEWDMSGIISKFPNRITTDNEPTDYYPIVRELALLKRSELEKFKERFQLSIEKARSNELVLPYRMACPRTNCGFVFISVTRDALPHRRKGLQNYTLANKYDLKLPKCIGVSIADDVDGWYAVEWLYVEFPWEQDAEMEELLRTNYPFREVKYGELPRYTYRDAK